MSFSATSEICYVMLTLLFNNDRVALMLLGNLALIFLHLLEQSCGPYCYECKIMTLIAWIGNMQLILNVLTPCTSCTGANAFIHLEIGNHLMHEIW